MKKILVGLIALIVVVQCKDKETIMPVASSKAPMSQKISGGSNQRTGNAYFVSITGNDATADGTAINPAKTLAFAMTKVPVNLGYTVVLSAGTFIEAGLIEVPIGVSIEGAGNALTIIKSASSFYYHPATPGYAPDRFLISLNGSSMANGNQSLRGFTIDGDSKQLHGGIYVKNRSNIIVDDVKVQNTNFTGIWFWDVKDSKILNSKLLNCSWGSASYCSGALNLGGLNQVEISGLDVNESTGYGIKAIGPGGNNNIVGLKIHDSRISVNPFGLWNNGTAPNIAIELWSVNLVGSEIYNSYVDNTISLINSNATPSTGVQTIRVHHNILDMETRAHGAGYGVELTIHDAEIDHNYFFKGSYGIANWDHPMKNWSIHHNTFYALEGTYPGEMVRSQNTGLHNVKVYNNTVEFAGTKTMNVVGVYGGSSDNVDVRNNLFINNNTGYSYYPNQLVHLENGAVLTNLQVKNNIFMNLPVGTVTGAYANNTTIDPKIQKSGNRADPYYMPQAASPLIDAGVNVGLAFTGSAPDIGAFEYAGAPNLLPIVNLTSPVSNAIISAGGSVTISASAVDNDGTVSKVQFFNGSVMLNEDTSSPYSFSWVNVASGSYTFTAVAFDNTGATATSPPVSITVSSATTAVSVALETGNAVLSGKMVISSDPTAGAGNFFSVPAGNGKNYYIPAPAGASFSFQISKADSYVVWVKVKTATSNNQSSYIYNGSGRWFTWSAGVHTAWTWVKITDGGSAALFPFSQGANNFKIGWLDDNVQVDQVYITNDRLYIPS
ncbi:hypothetical protein BH09BAC3_BH09BAC3_10360 [soil metagenome]